MPVVTVEMLKGRTIEQKRQLAKEVTDVVVSVLKIPPEAVSMIIREMEKDEWAVGGRLSCDK